MIDTNKIAIGDVFKHSKIGLVSNQPFLHKKVEDLTRVMDIKGDFFKVLASECIRPSIEEFNLYWHEIYELGIEGKVKIEMRNKKEDKKMVKRLETEMDELEKFHKETYKANIPEEYLIEDESVSNLPTEPGFYWARDKDSTERYSLIIQIIGLPPYLKYEGWNVTTNNIINGNIPSQYEFGPKIEIIKIPESAKEEGN